MLYLILLTSEYCMRNCYFLMFPQYLKNYEKESNTVLMLYHMSGTFIAVLSNVDSQYFRRKRVSNVLNCFWHSALLSYYWMLDIHMRWKQVIYIAALGFKSQIARDFLDCYSLALWNPTEEQYHKIVLKQSHKIYQHNRPV